MGRLKSTNQHALTSARTRYKWSGLPIDVLCTPKQPKRRTHNFTFTDHKVRALCFHHNKEMHQCVRAPNCHFWIFQTRNKTNHERKRKSERNKKRRQKTVNGAWWQHILVLLLLLHAPLMLLPMWHHLRRYVLPTSSSKHPPPWASTQQVIRMRPLTLVYDAFAAAVVDGDANAQKRNGKSVSLGFLAFSVVPC